MDVKAYAKINLTLDVLGKRPDGYHELETIMCAVSLADEVTLSFDCDRVTLVASPALPEGSVAYRAAKAYSDAAREKIGRACPASITIRRSIPEQAGLGGSSADAAAVLRAMQSHYSALDEAKLYSLALSLGSDVPFLLKGGAALCRGRGELMTPLALEKRAVLIVMGREGVSTKALFSSLRPPYEKRTTKTAVSALEAGDMQGFYASVGNALTPSAERLAPGIRANIERMRSLGALASSMTGSGSAVFGLFPSVSEARRAELAFTEPGLSEPGLSEPGFAEPAFTEPAFTEAAFTAVANML